MQWDHIQASSRYYIAFVHLSLFLQKRAFFLVLIAFFLFLFLILFFPFLLLFNCICKTCMLEYILYSSTSS